FWPSGFTHRSRRSSFGATIAIVIASSELSRVGWIPEPPWIVRDVPWKPKQSRYAATSSVGVGASPRIATRMPCPSGPTAWRDAIPYALRIWFGKRPAVEVTAPGYDVVAQPGSMVPVRVGVPPSTACACVRPAGDDDELAET